MISLRKVRYFRLRRNHISSTIEYSVFIGTLTKAFENIKVISLAGKWLK